MTSWKKEESEGHNTDNETTKHTVINAKLNTCESEGVSIKTAVLSKPNNKETNSESVEEVPKDSTLLNVVCEAIL